MAQIIFSTAATIAAKVTGMSAATASYVKLGASVAGQVADKYLVPGEERIQQGARVEMLEVQTATYGRMIPIIYGTIRITGNIIWSTPIKETSHVTHHRAGGKGGGGTTTQRTNYHYSVSLAIALGERPIDTIHRV